MGNKVAVRHKPHGVLAVLGPYNFPAHLPNGHIVPALIAGQCGGLQTVGEDPRDRRFPGRMLPRGRRSGRRHPLADRRARPRARALAGQDGIDGLLFTGSARAGMALHRQFAETPHKILALELGGNNPIVVWDAPDLPGRGGDHRPVGLSLGRPALHRGAAADRRGRPARSNWSTKSSSSSTASSSTIRMADPQPFMGPVIDVAAADILQEQWIGADDEGRQADPPARPPLRGAALSDPGADRRDRRQGPPRRGIVRPGAAADPGQGFRRGDRRGQQHALRPGGERR